MDSMHEIIMGLPLMKGVSKEKIMEIAGVTKFHFLKYLPEQPIVSAGETCTHLKFLISGKVRVSITNGENGRFVVGQTLHAPDVIMPDYLFGLDTTYPGAVTAIEPTGIMQVSKTDYLRILTSDQVFLFNYLNLLSSNSQKGVKGILSISDGSLEERIAFWIVSLTQRTGTDITLSCRQRDLYSMFGVQRTSFYATLNSMRERGILDYSPNEIRIKSRKDLLNILASNAD